MIIQTLHLVLLLQTFIKVRAGQNNFYESFPPNNYQEHYPARQYPNQQHAYRPSDDLVSNEFFGGNGGNNNFGDFNNGLDLPDPNVPRTIRVLIPQPYPVHVNVEQPVQIPVYRVVPQIIEKPVPYTVEKPFPVEVKKLYPVEVIKKVEVSVPKPYPVPFTIYKHIVVDEQTYKLQAKQDGGEATESKVEDEEKPTDSKTTES